MNMEITDFKKLQVDKENAEVSYNDEAHRYWTKKGLNPCVSVTTLIHQFTTFDEFFWSRYKALELVMTEDDFKSAKPRLLDKKVFDPEILKDYNISESNFNDAVETILAEWEEKRERACERGTKIHLDYELKTLAKDYSGIDQFDVPRFYEGGSFKLNTSNIIEEGQYVLPELLLSRISDDGILRIAGQADLVIIDGTEVTILDYKGLALDTPILTTKGFKLLEDINYEDVIFDKDGNKTNIKNISEVHYNPCYKIIFDNGDELIADHEHRWEISFWKSKGKYQTKVLTTLEVLEYFNKYKETKNTSYLPKIINSKPINTEDVELPIDPYVFGAWLGDGSKSCGIITNINPDFWKEIENRGYDFGDNLNNEDRSEMRTIYDIRGRLNDLNVLNNKHIPNEYLLASKKQRLDLLRGFMDTDGHYNAKRKRFVMRTGQEWQANDLYKLLATLGVKATILPAIATCDGKKFQAWDVCFTMQENPFLIRNQEGIEYPNTDKASFRNIKNIELIETVPTKCLEVDSPSHTFLAGEGLIVTHNTNREIKTKSFYDRKKRSSEKMKYPLNHLDDVNYFHYEMQLSTYGWIIEKNNPHLTVKGLYLLHHDHKDKKTVYECTYRKDDVERMLAFHKKQLNYEQHKNKLKR